MLVNLGNYVVFDGMDGSGKGTQIAMLEKLLGERVVFTREPGGTPFAEKIRGLARDDPLAEHASSLANLLLFFAAREELQFNLIEQMLQEGKTVFSDRGDSSTWAFQICGEMRRPLIGIFNKLRNEVFAGPRRKPPDLYIVFDLPAEEARERVMAANRNDLNHFDVRDLAYYERVREGFREFGKQYPPVVFIDASQTPDRVHRDVLMALSGHMIFPELGLSVS